VSLDAAWARSAPWLAAALAQAGGTHRLEDVRRLVESGQAQFWAAADAAVVTVVEEDPCERRLLVWLAGGRLATLLGEMLPGVEAWARGQGCARLLLIGRAGWERAMKPMGYAPLARVIAKDL
jgi:hypothetical protein